MAVDTIKLETLISNVDELYELAKLTECKTTVPISELHTAFARQIERSTPQIQRQFTKLFSRGKVEEIIIGGAALCFAYVGASAIDFTRNSIAQKKARDALLPLYKEIAVKTQTIILQLSEDQKALQNMLLEEKQRNINNQSEINELRKRIEKNEAILEKFAALLAKG